MVTVTSSDIALLTKRSLQSVLPGRRHHRPDVAVFIFLFSGSRACGISQAPVVQWLDNAIHRKNRYPVYKC